ncbi:carbon-nitrogen hydrolase family protein [Mycolicibacterium sp. S2-37]|uniref:carbon-nitrogen hydrolase family protein n=1 Tax=Mycolicibacterium sp. S2-37 TaxID=2810297 RepID=UPI001A93AF41|nr:carbon-nitrogen hydrolase family protein [Mycolicibacterium sp. S2-37]MBO0677575.1 carbon-nitrogen hydrolase family protein [Mycolicibacterium sp. S2-37]
MSRPLAVALAQYAPLTGPDPVAALHRQATEIRSGAADLDLIVFPEIHLLGDCDTVDDANAWLKAAAEPLDGPRMRALSEVAKDLGVWLIPGSVAELGDDSRVYNTEVVFDPSGELVASYRKVFPWRPYEAWSSGHEFVVFDMPGIGRGGLSICYDAWFPESTRSVAWMGAEFVVNVVKTIGADRKQERILAQANAIVNQVFMLSVNAAGPVGWGGSIVSDPEGAIVADLPAADPGLMTLTIDLDDVTRVRDVGTEGYNRMWSQMAPDDPLIDLPIYDGRIDPTRWQPSPPQPRPSG